MAQIFLNMKANGEDVPLESTMESIAGTDLTTNHCQVHGLNWITKKDYGARGGMSTSRDQPGPVIFKRTMDKASPVIIQAFKQNQAIDANILIFADDPVSGETKHFYTIGLYRARITHYEVDVAGATLHEGHDSVHDQVIETIHLAFTQKEDEHIEEGTSFMYDWQVQNT